MITIYEEYVMKVIAGEFILKWGQLGNMYLKLCSGYPTFINLIYQNCLACVQRYLFIANKKET